jgi:hypothetical protein
LDVAADEQQQQEPPKEAPRTPQKKTATTPKKSKTDAVAAPASAATSGPFVAFYDGVVCSAASDKKSLDEQVSEITNDTSVLEYGTLHDNWKTYLTSRDKEPVLSDLAGEGKEDLVTAGMIKACWKQK